MTVVAENRETIDGLHGYLNGAGVVSRTTRSLADVAAVPASTSAVVLFPDEFEPTEVTRCISSLRARGPKVLLVIVTSTPQRLRAALGPNGSELLPVVLPKPAFGWSILDAIREHANAHPASGNER